MGQGRGTDTSVIPDGTVRNRIGEAEVRIREELKENRWARIKIKKKIDDLTDTRTAKLALGYNVDYLDKKLSRFRRRYGVAHSEIQALEQSLNRLLNIHDKENNASIRKLWTAILMLTIIAITLGVGVTLNYIVLGDLSKELQRFREKTENQFGEFTQRMNGLESKITDGFAAARDELKVLSDSFSVRFAEMNKKQQDDYDQLKGGQEATTHLLMGVKAKVDITWEGLAKTNVLIGSIEKNLIGIFGERRWYHLGCLPAGTLITLDEFGNTIPIELLYLTSHVWSPEFGRVEVTNLIRGPETGFFWEIKTSGGLKANMTQTHPLKILNKEVGDEWLNVPAKKAQVGDVILTEQGLQSIAEIKKYPVEDTFVYNFEIVVPDSTPLARRSVIVNGIEMLDYAAQQAHKSTLHTVVGWLGL